MPNKLHLILLVSTLLTFGPIAGPSADKIFLKDGTVEESERVWASEKYIHFILKGTTSVEIRFLKDIVLRVESDSLQYPEDIPTASVPKTATAKARPLPAKSKPEMRPPEQPGQSNETLPRLNQGVSFYDPRRPERYWADRNTRFNSLAQALSTIALRYGRTTAWVTEHMGEENDLGRIYANLNQRLAYEADEAIPSQPQPPPAPAMAPVENMKEKSPAGPGLDELLHVKGIPFYDPRRTPKYRVAPDEGYDTLNEALSALAHQYKTTVQWIEGHMGDSNALTEIHHNLSQSLKK